MGSSMVPAILLLTYLLLGVDEIGVEIGEPFCIFIPVRPLADMCETEGNKTRHGTGTHGIRFQAGAEEVKIVQQLVTPRGRFVVCTFI